MAVKIAFAVAACAAAALLAVLMNTELTRQEQTPDFKAVPVNVNGAECVVVTTPRYGVAVSCRWK